MHIIGEVQNNSNQTVSSVRVTTNLFNSGGQFVGTDTAYAYVSRLAAGDHTCFNILLPQPADWSYYEFQTPTFSFTSSPIPSLTTYNENAYINQYGWYEIIGFVRNDDTTQITSTEIVATVYSADGTPLDCDSTYANTSTLNPGESSSFKNTMTGLDDYNNVTDYRLQTDGYRQ